MPRTEQAGKTVTSKEEMMLRTTWIYRLAFLAALMLAAGAGTKWT
jgi:hypothetical protein